MNGLRGDGEARVRALLERHRARPGAGTLGICPPAPLLIPLHGLLRNSAIVLGGQDCSSEPRGAHTGDISASMLSDAGCRIVTGSASDYAEGLPMPVVGTVTEGIFRHNGQVDVSYRMNREQAKP